MSSNVEKFEKYLEENKIVMLKGTNIENYTQFTFPEKLEINGEVKNIWGGGKYSRVVLALSNDNTVADLYCFNIIKVPEKVDLYKLYTVLNELNATYKFLTFYESEDFVSAKACLPFADETFSPEFISNFIQMMYQSIKKEYPKIAATLE